MRWACVTAIVCLGMAMPTKAFSADAAVACLDAIRATFRLHGDGQSGTAFLVAVPGGRGVAEQVLVVSAAHTFELIKQPQCTAIFRGAGADGNAHRREESIQLQGHDKPLWVRHPTADVAVLPYTIPEGIDQTPFPLERLATAADFNTGKVGVGQRIRVACYPAQTEANAAGWPVLRTGAIASHPLRPAVALETFFVDYAHFGGDSGAAVVLDAGPEPLVVGVVVAMQRQTDRLTSPFEEKTIHTPLGLAIAVPSTLVSETIDRWRQSEARSGLSAD
jgi:hypothetical protein